MSNLERSSSVDTHIEGGMTISRAINTPAKSITSSAEARQQDSSELKSLHSNTEEIDGSHSPTYIAINRPLPTTPGDHEQYQVDYMGPDDPENPVNWPLKIKVMIMALAALSTFMVSFNSAVIGGGVLLIMKEFHVGQVVATLNVSLYVIGFAVGPIAWGPLSEIYGRMPITLLCHFVFTCFTWASATAKDFQTLVLSRFFAGAIGSAMFVVVPGMMADLFNTQQRGLAMSTFAMVLVAAPMIAPVAGGYIAASHLGWRWSEYVTAIVSSAAMVGLLFLKETFPPLILVGKARRLREKTGNWALFASFEGMTLEPSRILDKTVKKPIVMLFTEPILFLISVYLGFIYGILYLCLEGVPIIFIDYGWKNGNVFLPYLGMLVGSLLCTFVDIFFFQKKFRKDLAASGKPVLPEARLPLMILCGVFLPIGIFLMCWSGAYFVHWIVPTIGCAFIGFGLVGLFLAALNYLIDTYLLLAASALAANTFVRSGFGGAFPLFARAMFKNLGTQWAGTLLGCIGAILVPVPVCFYIWGGKIRSYSKFAPDIDNLMQKS